MMINETQHRPRAEGDVRVRSHRRASIRLTEVMR